MSSKPFTENFANDAQVTVVDDDKKLEREILLKHSPSKPQPSYAGTNPAVLSP